LHLPGYIHRELAPELRAQIGAHLDRCVGCYAVYREQRALASELAETIPLVGRGAPPLERIWNAVQADVRHPKRAVIRHDQARYSLIVLILLAALLIPWSARGELSILPTPPTPAASSPQGTEVAYSSETTLSQNLTPPLRVNYAPQAGATDTP
jgi:anti-sigma factor RsiW